MALELTEALPSLVKRKFEAAKASSDLVFSPTDVAIIRTSNGIPFQLRYCPSLAKKPLPNLAGATPKQKIDPFENPPEALHLVDIPRTNPTHFLVLNKFPIIPQHFILATKPNKRQTHALEQADLEATYACLQAWHNDTPQRRLLAFFNSGAHSGASQPHRHVQFLPVESMRDGDKTAGWDMLVDAILSSNGAGADTNTPTRLLQHPDLPFTHFAQRFGSAPTGPDLLAAYKRLYEAAKAAVESFVASNPGQLALHAVDDEGDLPISYNLAMTTAGMAILPRRAEGAMLRRDEDGTEVGFVALNGTALAGTLMVKNQGEWERLRSQPALLDALLVGIGIPRAGTSVAANI